MGEVNSYEYWQDREWSTKIHKRMSHDLPDPAVIHLKSKMKTENVPWPRQDRGTNRRPIAFFVRGQRYGWVQTKGFVSNSRPNLDQTFSRTPKESSNLYRWFLGLWINSKDFIAVIENYADQKRNSMLVGWTPFQCSCCAKMQWRQWSYTLK